VFQKINHFYHYELIEKCNNKNCPNNISIIGSFFQHPIHFSLHRKDELMDPNYFFKNSQNNLENIVPNILKYIFNILKKNA